MNDSLERKLEPLPLSAQQVVENMHEGVIITDSRGIIQSVNRAFSHVTGWQVGDIVGKSPSVLQSGRHKPTFYKKLWNGLERTGFWQGEIYNRRKNGDIYLEYLSISTVRDPEGQPTHYIGVFTDITKRKRAEETIKHMAYYDALTNLPNRALFLERLNQALIQAQRNRRILAVLFLDLDRLKVINDTLGHNMGDRLLKAVSARLKSAMRDTDTVARLGGDEFMLLLPEIANATDIDKITAKLLDTFTAPFDLDGQELYVTASVGVAVYPKDGSDAETLLKNADTAMYRAKRTGRNNCQVFAPSMKAEDIAQLALSNGLRRALEKREFVVHYQPQLDIENGEIVGMEALVRWQHPEFGLVHPNSFIHWAEDSGLIVPLGEMVMQIACEQNRMWISKGFTPMKVAVNISARQLRQDNIVHTVARILKETGLPPDCLELELTESVLMDLGENSTNMSHELKAMGVGFSIDDFGTGYSSLNYIKRLPVNTLKLDQSFVRDVTTDPNDAAIASAVIGLGHGLNLAVLAEGVETMGQLDYLRSLKCDRMQGFLFSEPLPANEFEELLKEQRKLDMGTLFERPHQN
jgi:diguanylate cyclase (GGDEF)-like protein/PAS domain S-box-containing protein